MPSSTALQTYIVWWIFSDGNHANEGEKQPILAKSPDMYDDWTATPILPIHMIVVFVV